MLAHLKIKVPNVCKERGGSCVHIVEQIDCSHALGQKQQQQSPGGLEIYQNGNKKPVMLYRILNLNYFGVSLFLGNITIFQKQDTMSSYGLRK